MEMFIGAVMGTIGALFNRDLLNKNPTAFAISSCLGYGIGIIIMESIIG